MMNWYDTLLKTKYDYNILKANPHPQAIMYQISKLCAHSSKELVVIFGLAKYI